MNVPKISLIPDWTPPAKDPSFAKWLQDVLDNPTSGPRPYPHEYLDQLVEETGYSEAELCELFGFPADFYQE